MLAKGVEHLELSHDVLGSVKWYSHLERKGMEVS